MANKIVDVTLRFVDNFTKPMQGAIGSLEKHAKQYKRMGREIESTGKSISAVGKNLTTAVTVPVVGLGVAAVKTAADFESGMSKVQSIVGKVADDSIGDVIASAEKMGLSFEKSSDSTETAMNILAAKAKQMGAQTKFSATESADAFSYMAMAGWKAEDMLEGIEGIMYLAGASGEELGATSDIVTDALTAFGMSASDTNRFVDVLAKTASNANTNVSLMGETFQYVAPVAGALGYKVEDVSVAIGLMANSGIKASSAGTALRSLLTNLAKPTDSVEAAMTKLGISLTDSQGNMKDFSVLMKEMRGSFANLTEAQKAEYAATLAGKTGMSGLLAIVNSSDSDFDKLTESIANSTGAAKEMYDVANDNLQGQLTVLKSTLESIAITFGEKLMPYVKKGAEKLQILATRFSEMNDKTFDTIIKFAAVAAAVGPALLMFGKMVTGVGKVISFAGKLGGALAKAGGVMGLITSPAGIVVMVLGAIVVATILVIKNWDKVKAAAEKVFGFVKQIFASTGNSFSSLAEKFSGIKEKMGTVVEAAKGLWAAISPTMTKIGEIVTKVFGVIMKGAFAGAVGYFSSFVSSIMEYVSNVVDVFKGIITFITGVFTGDWDKAWDGIKQAFGGVFKNMLTIATAPFKAIISAVKGVASAFGISFDDMSKSADGCFAGLGEMIAAVKPKLQAIGEVIKNVWSVISPVLNQIGKLFTKIFIKGLGVAIESAKGYFSSWIDSIKSVINGVKKVISGIITFITGIFTGDWKKAWEGVKNIFSGAFSALVSLAKAPLSALVSAMKAPFEAIKNLVHTAMEFVKQKIMGMVTNADGSFTTLGKVFMGIQGAVEFVKSAISGLWNFVSPLFSAIGSLAKTVFQSTIASVLTTAGGLFQTFASTISGVIGGIQTVFSGLISFITGVFTGNWGKAWEGVKSIFSGAFDALVSLAKAPINAVISLINGAISGLNKISVSIPDWVPAVGGKTFGINIPTIPMLYKGTDNWIGGPAMIHDRGAEIVDLPKGSRVIPHDKSLQIAKEQGSKSVTVTIAKIADSIIVREEADIDKIANLLAQKLEDTALNMGVV